jgi:RNase P subunit RPR2
MVGKRHSAASKKKMSVSNTGKIKTSDHKSKISEALVGRKFSEEHLNNLSISAKTKPRMICEHCNISVTKTNYTKWHGNNCGKIPELVTCLHCGQSGQRGGMYRWHFDNCKNKVKDG